VHTSKFKQENRMPQVNLKTGKYAIIYDKSKLGYWNLIGQNKLRIMKIFAGYTANHDCKAWT